MCVRKVLLPKSEIHMLSDYMYMHINKNVPDVIRPGLENEYFAKGETEVKVSTFEYLVKIYKS
jgi:hypothetical protein